MQIALELRKITLNFPVELQASKLLPLCRMLVNTTNIWLHALLLLLYYKPGGAANWPLVPLHTGFDSQLELTMEAC